MFNGILRLLIEGYLEICISSILNLISVNIIVLYILLDILQRRDLYVLTNFYYYNNGYCCFSSYFYLDIFSC
jgi:hypothetical protein